MPFSPLTKELIEALRCLPGVGPKSAQRMAFHLLERNRDRGQQLAQALHQAIDKVGHCKQCRTFSEMDICHLCANTKRDPSLLCIVETPADIVAIEQTGSYRGHYFVLMGHLSPLDGIGPEDLGVDELRKRIQPPELKEIILATNHTVEGEATAHYISELINPLKLKVSRIAHGVPLGSELNYVDSSTLSEAIMGRLELE